MTTLRRQDALRRLGAGRLGAGWVGAAVIAFTALATTALAGSAHASGDDETSLYALLNGERQSHGLAPLHRDAALDAGAAQHSSLQVGQRRLSHAILIDVLDAGAGATRWARVAENVGVAASAPALHRTLMESPSHRAAMLDPGFDDVGIAVADGGDGRRWLTMRFADRRGPAPASTDPGRSTSSSGVVTTVPGSTFYGDLRGSALAAPIVGLVSTPSSAGYWLVAADGGVFAFGDAAFHGSAAAFDLDGAIVSMTAAPDGSGYWLAGADGGVFAFGAAPFLGRVVDPTAPVARINRTSTGAGYALYDATGTRYGFGDAR